MIEDPAFRIGADKPWRIEWDHKLKIMKRIHEHIAGPLHLSPAA
jgi:hypothetical protein